MHLRALRYFVTLAREGHFARAAEQCGVTQPTLSSAIVALEQEIGKRLILRDRRYNGLTEEGKAMLPWAQQMLAAHDGLLHAVDALAGPLHGEFRLGVIPAAIPAIGGFSQALFAAYPALSLSLRSLTSREIVAGLHAFELDAGITYLDHEPPGDMLSVSLYPERYFLVAAAGAGFDDRTSIGWAEAAEEPLCLLHQAMQNRRILDGCLAARGLSVVPRATADSYVALLALVRSGSFATIVPDRYRDLLDGARWARFVPLEDAPPVSRVGLIVADRVPLSPIAAAALTAAQHAARGEFD